MSNQMLEDDNWFAYDVNRESLTILELTRLFNIYFFAICWPQQQELNIARTHIKKVDIETHVIKKKAYIRHKSTCSGIQGAPSKCFDMNMISPFRGFFEPFYDKCMNMSGAEIIISSETCGE